MNQKEIEFHIQNYSVPTDIHHLLEALIFDAQGKWDAAHKIAQDDPSTDGAWVHAYLHRKEGDIWNSKYWYSRSGRIFTTITFQEEWNNMVEYFLKKNAAINS